MFVSLTSLSNFKIVSDDVPFRLLLEVLLAASHDLLHDAKVVLRAGTKGRSKVARLLEDRLARGRRLVVKLLRQGVELSETAGLVVEEAASRAVCAALLVEELDECFLGTRAVVVNRRICVKEMSV